MATNKFKVWCSEYGLETIRRYAEEGVSEAEIAKRCGITPTTFRKWKEKYPKLSDAVELGRRDADFSVVEAVYKKATGFNVLTNKTHKLKRIDYDPDTGKKLREYEELAVGVDEEYIAPDLKAGIFWLKNRQPENWSDRTMTHEESREGGIVELPSADRIDAAPEAFDLEAEEG